MEVKSLVPEKKIKAVNISTTLLTDRSSRQELIINYRKTDSKTFSVYNLPYIQILNTNMNSLTKFWLYFQGICVIRDDIYSQIAFYEKECQRISQLLAKISVDLQQSIDYYESRYDQAQEKMNLFNQRNSVVANKRETELELMEVMLKMQNKDKLIAKFRDMKERERKRTEEYAEFDKDINLSKEMLSHLNFYKARIEERTLEYLREEKNALDGHLTFLEEYIKEIEAVPNILIDQEKVNLEEMATRSEALFNYFREFKGIAQRASNLWNDSSLREECMRLIYEKIGLHNEYLVCKAVFNFIESERQHRFSRMENREGSVIASDTVDRSLALKRSFQQSQDNLFKLTSDLDSIRLEGGITYTVVRERHGHYGECRSSEHVTTYFTNLYTDFRISKSHTHKAYIRPDEYTKSQKTSRLEVDYQIAVGEYQTIYNEYMEVKGKIDYYDGLVKKIKEISDKITEMDQQKGEELNKLELKYKKFYEKLKMRDYPIDKDLLTTLMAGLLKNINIRVKPGCCFCAPGALEANEINATDIYAVFLSVLKVNKKKMIGYCCYTNDISKVHSCEEVTIDDIKCLVMDIRILGALKSSDGGHQEIKKEF